MNYIDKEWAELERRSEKIDKVEKIVRTISGWATAIILFLDFRKSWCFRLWRTVGRNFPVNIYLLWIDDPIVSYMGVRWR